LEIWNTAGTGECIYLGCQGNYSTTPCYVRDCVIEDCYCHDTCKGGGNVGCSGGSYGSGFQVKFGSYRNVIRNNVCYNVNSPCVLIYDDWDKGANIVEGNLIVNTVSDSGIQVAAGAIFRNNVIINSGRSGITVTSNPVDLYNGLGNRNLRIYQNTIINNAMYGIEFGSTPSNTIVMNNAVLGNKNNDFSSVSQSGTGVIWRNNAYNTGLVPAGVPGTGAFLVGSVTSEFTSPDTYNVYPLSSSLLLNAGYGNGSGIPYDFNYNPRSGCTPTVGAYEFGAPGWIPQTAIKVITGTVTPCTSTGVCSIPCIPVVNKPAPSQSITVPLAIGVSVGGGVCVVIIIIIIVLTMRDDKNFEQP